MGIRKTFADRVFTLYIVAGSLEDAKETSFLLDSIDGAASYANDTGDGVYEVEAFCDPSTVRPVGI